MNRKQIIFVEEFINHKPNFDRVDDIFTNVLFDCAYKYFHSLNNQFHIYDLNFTNIKNIKAVNIKLKQYIPSGGPPLSMEIGKIKVKSQNKNKFK